jgi:phosphoglycolate phosphatase-like HAD superfamily hydrolase
LVTGPTGDRAERIGARPAVKHIVWDWNGTLLDDNDAVVAGVNAVCAQFGHEPISLEHWREVYSLPLVPCYERLLGRSVAAAEWDALELLYHETYRDVLRTTRLAAGVPAELHRWAATGGSQSLLSMWYHLELMPLVKEYRLTSLFTRVDGLRTRSRSGCKTEHLAAHLAVQRLDPATVLVIGDALYDAAAASAVGAQCVLVATGVMSERKLQTAGVPVASTVADALRIATTRR